MCRETPGWDTCPAFSARTSEWTNEMFELCDLVYVRCLRAFLTLSDFELDLIAFLQAFVSFGGDGTVVNKDIRPVRPPDEPVSLRVIEPLHRPFQSFHENPLQSARPFDGGQRTCSPIGCILLPEG